MDFPEFKRLKLLDELARLGASDGVRARLIDAINFPRAHVPAFRDSYSFWLEVTRAIEDGIAADVDLDSLARAVLKLYPGNKAFRAAAGARHENSAISDTREHLRVLMLSASPDGYPLLRIDVEAREIRKALLRAAFRDRVKLEVSSAIQAKDILEEVVRFNPHLLHFSGHSDALGQMLTDDGKVEASKLAQLLLQWRSSGGKLGIALLNACWSAVAARNLQKANLLAIGWAAEVDDKPAIAFARAFYVALANKQEHPVQHDFIACGRLAHAQAALEGFELPDLKVADPRNTLQV